MKKYLLLFITLLVSFLWTPIYAISFSAEGFTFETIDSTDNKVRISGIEQEFVNLVIPANVTYEGSNYTVTQVSINNVKWYKRLENIKSITLPSTITLFSILGLGGIPSGFSLYIEDLASYCAIHYPNQSLTELAEGFYVNGERITDLIIPEAATIVDRRNFFGCNQLKSVTIGNNVKSIGESAFSSCKNLEKVIIGSSVEVIDRYAFAFDDNLSSLTINSNKLHTIDFGAFLTCKSLTSVNLPSSITQLGDYAFASCYNLSSISIPDGVTSIGMYAFRYCSLSTIHLPKELTAISTALFYGCKNLVFPIIPEKVKTIDAQAFYGCNNVSAVSLPASVSSLGNEVFLGCTGITSITCKNPSAPTCTEETFRDFDFTLPLYVPKGSVLKYKAATGWRNFVIIREINESEDQNIYLSINQAHGNTLFKVDSDKPYYTLKFVADNGWKVHSVTFNDEDVTAELSSDNEYTTPAITVNSHIIVTYEQTETQAISFMPLNNVTMKALPNGVEINNISKGTSCSVYTLDGISTTQVTATDDNIFIPLSSGRTYIVKAAGKTFKVAL